MLPLLNCGFDQIKLAQSDLKHTYHNLKKKKYHIDNSERCFAMIESLGNPEIYHGKERKKLPSIVEEDKAFDYNYLAANRNSNTIDKDSNFRNNVNLGNYKEMLRNEIYLPNSENEFLEKFMTQLEKTVLNKKFGKSKFRTTTRINKSFGNDVDVMKIPRKLSFIKKEKDQSEEKTEMNYLFTTRESTVESLNGHLLTMPNFNKKSKYKLTCNNPSTRPTYFMKSNNRNFNNIIQAANEEVKNSEMLLGRLHVDMKIKTDDYAKHAYNASQFNNMNIPQREIKPIGPLDNQTTLRKMLINDPNFKKNMKNQFFHRVVNKKIYPNGDLDNFEKAKLKLLETFRNKVKVHLKTDSLRTQNKSMKIS